MPYFEPPAKNEISGIPGVDPDNATATAGFAKWWDSFTGLFGTTGKPGEAFAAMKLLDSKTLLNMKPTFGVAANALTITVKDKDAVNLSEDNPGFVSQRHATIGDGGFNLRKVAANIALVISSGSTLGHVANVLLPIYIYLIDNAGVQELAVSRTFNGEVGIFSTTAEGGAGGADSATTIYSTNARASLAGQLIAVAWLTQAVAGNWVNLPTRVHVPPFGIEIPEQSDALKRKPQTSNNAVDAAKDIDIIPGAVVDSAGVTIMSLLATLTKQIDVAWAVGNNQGGMLTGAVAANTFYGLWLIERSDTGVVDAGFDPSFTTPTLPANYDRAWLASVVRTDGLPAIVPYYQDGDFFRFRAERIVLAAGTATASTAVTISSGVPSIAESFTVSARATFTFSTTNTVSSNNCIVRVATGVDYAFIAGASGCNGNNPAFPDYADGGMSEIPNTGVFEYRNNPDNTGSHNSTIRVHGFKLSR